ncbi:MAG: glycoside hydrolase family 97 protein [Muribaculaceae bacterium]|nr:glycoside hydrolase family 97 protein [Muribaculaceae bacterium]
MKKLSMLLGAAMLVNLAAFAREYTLSSPDEQVKVTVDAGKDLTWSVEFGGKEVVAPSRLGLDIDGLKNQPGAAPKVKSVTRRHVDDLVVSDVPLKFRNVHELYNEMSLKMAGGYQVQFRAYNNGAAYRFVLDMKGDVIVNNEIVELNMPDGTFSYWPMDKYHDFKTPQETKYEKRALSTLDDNMKGFLPIYMNTPDGSRVVVTEADVEDYSNLFLTADSCFTLLGEFPRVVKQTKLIGDRTEQFVELAPYIAKISGKRSLPWRVVMLADSDAPLLENDLAWQLSSRSAIGDASWIKPGKVSWDWYSRLNVYGVDFEAGVNTPTYKHIIDFAAEKGIEYILLDEGWSQGTWDLTHYKPEVNVEELVKYGAEKGVGIVLWSLWNPLVDNIEEIFDVYQKWGVKGVKIDFMNRSDQDMVNFYEHVGKAAADRHLLIDFHGAYKPCGVHSKYPNVMTFEGVLGMEHNKDSRDVSPDHNLTLPFTRMMAGPLDYTPGAVNNKTAEDFSINFNHPMSLGTRAQQAALFVIYESPLQMVADSPSNFRLAPEYADFIAAIPTVWDETIGIDAQIAEYLLMARRSGDDWYIGALTDWTPRDMELKLDFLPEGCEYQMTIFADGRNAHKEGTDYKITKIDVRKGDIIPFHMAPGGGYAAIIKRVR